MPVLVNIYNKTLGVTLQPYLQYVILTRWQMHTCTLYSILHYTIQFMLVVKLAVSGLYGQSAMQL